MPARTVKATTRPGKSRPADGLSIVVPVFNEAKGLVSLHDRIAEVARFLQSKRNLAVEVVYVDDGSSDNTAAIAREMGAAVIPSRTLPDGWRGKTWACHQTVS